MSKTSIKCPSCGAEIDVNEAIYHQLENRLKQENIAKKKELEAEIEAKRREYKAAFSALETQKERFEEDLKKATKEEIKKERQKLEEELKKSILEEQKESIELLKNELLQKSEQVKELNLLKIETERLKREKEEMELKIRADAETLINTKIKEEREKIQKESDEKNELKLKQKEEQLDMLKKQLQDAQRRAEQSSQQLQGEVMELAIEEWLRERFPFDSIEEVKKGARGADCMQIVHTRDVQNCGKIYYESKRTKEFQKSWIEKFKTDMRDKGADIGVLVSEVMPSELDRMGLYEGVWVCSFEEFKGLSSVLRESIIRINQAFRSQENRNDKMGLLYNYLISNEFQMQIEAIVEGFTQMQSDLDSEKRSMQRIWKQREKQIEKVLDNTVSMYGSIRGIAGSAIGHIKALELPYQSMEDE